MSEAKDSRPPGGPAVKQEKKQPRGVWVATVTATFDENCEWEYKDEETGHEAFVDIFEKAFPTEDEAWAALTDKIRDDYLTGIEKKNLRNKTQYEISSGRLRFDVLKSFILEKNEFWNFHATVKRLKNLVWPELT